MHLTIGVTGHRDLMAGDLPAIRERVREFFEKLQREFPGLELQLISPLAEGSDQLVAEVALELGIRLIVPMPMQQSVYEQDFATQAGLDNFRRLLEHAEVIPLPLVKGSTHADMLSDAAVRDWQYAQLGVFVSNHCQILLALWNGKPDTQTGGTAGVVN
jgi:hypothetical protein